MNCLITIKTKIMNFRGKYPIHCKIFLLNLIIEHISHFDIVESDILMKLTMMMIKNISIEDYVG